MSHSALFLSRLWPLLCIGFLATSVRAARLEVFPERANGIYRVGETIKWQIEWNGAGAPPSAHYVLKRGGLTEIAAGQVVFTADAATLESKLDAPDTLLLEVTSAQGDDSVKSFGGAVASPERLQPSSAAPEDFDEFWAGKLTELGAVPANPMLKSLPSPRADVERWQVTLDHFRGSRLHGQLARPAAQSTDLPALLIVQWAGVYGLEPEWATDRATEGWLVFNVLPHDLPIDAPPEFYAAQRAGDLKHYGAIGAEDRETSYFLRMYLSCYRAVEYLKSRPEWNGRTLVVMGTSQGGQQALVTAGLHRDVTAALALVPAGSDTLAPLHGRAPAYPNWHVASPAVRETSRYFDVAHFAARITCPVLVGNALEDTVCPPATVFAAINQIKSYKEVVVLARSGHQDVAGSQDPYEERCYRGWLPALRRGLAAPAGLTAAEDHQRLLRELGIAALRPGANPHDPNSPQAVNTDEAQATPYSKLPDVLIARDGTPVTMPDQWWQIRRGEIAEAFEHEVYGRVPENLPGVSWEVREQFEEMKGDTRVVTKRLAGRVDNSAYPFLEVVIDLSLSTPVDATGPVPVMLHFGWPPQWLAAFPPVPGPTWEEQALARGWGVATIIPTSFQSDHGAGLTQGIIGLGNRGQPRSPEQWGALRAWAWGASRALDYFETDPAVDARQVGLEGLSRYGKAALVAMAFDQRFALAFVSSSGAAGAKLHRRTFGELVENIASTGAYHWVAGNYLKYAGPLTPDDLPVDAHQLIALCAPRPVYIGAGAGAVEGHWIDQRGMFLAAAAASPVYDLLNQRGLDINEMPSIGRALDHGALAWRQHAGGHTSWPNWPAFLSWADRYITAPAAGRWLPTWTTALQVVEPQNLPPAPGFTNATVRQKLMTSIGGERLRVRFSNTFGDAPLTIERAAVARSASTDTIDARTAQSLTFGGAASVTIPPGAQWVSDAVDFATDPLSPLAVTIYTLTAPARITGHPGSRTTSYFSHADTPVDAVALPQPIPVERWYFLSGIEVLSRQPDAAVLVVVGDSITDGRGSTTDGNNRWPDVLSRRLRAHSATANVAVLNQGIGGNCVLRGGLGPTLLARLDRDVFSQPGVRWLILYEGINDLGGVASAAAKGERVTTGEDLIAAFDQIVTRARAHGIKILGATIMPFEGAFYYSAAGEAARQKLNRWIRESGRFDAVIDFDALMRDPAAPTRLQAAYDSGDHLHLNTVGLARLGEAIDVRLFE